MNRLNLHMCMLIMMLMLTCVDIVVPDDVDVENLVWTRFRN